MKKNVFIGLCLAFYQVFYFLAVQKKKTKAAQKCLGISSFPYKIKSVAAPLEHRG